jgi:hypothetical protein
VGRHVLVGQVHLELGVVSPHGGGELPEHRTRQRHQVDALGAELQRAGVEPREVEQVHGQLLKPLDLLAHGLEELPSGLLVQVLVLEELNEATQREDRRAQLVRGRGHEGLARHVQLAQSLLHLVERPRQLAQLVLGVDRQRVDLAPRGHTAGRALQPPHAARERLSGEVAAHYRDQEPHAGGGQHPVAHGGHGLHHVVQAARVQRDPLDTPAVGERLGHLLQPLPAEGVDPGPNPPAAGGRLGQAVVRGDVPRLARIRRGVEAQRAVGRVLDVQQRQARVRRVGHVSHLAVDVVRADVAEEELLERRAGGGGGPPQVVARAALEVRLQLRDHERVRHRERRQHDAGEDEGQPGAERAGAQSAHWS